MKRIEELFISQWPWKIGRSEGMNVFVRCESCVKKCKHRNEVNRTTGDTVDGCIVNEHDVDKYTKGTNND